MIHEIAPHTLKNEYRNQKPKDSDTCILFTNGEMLLAQEKLTFLTFSEIIALYPELSEKIYLEAEYLFMMDDQSYYLFLVEEKLEPKEGYQFYKQEVFRTLEPMYQAFAGITACQLYRFKQNNRFCGRCGNTMKHSPTERAYLCEKCGRVVYPTISPAIIVAITDKDRLLLTKYAGGTYRKYALVAGFVEVGETFEEAVRREVMEEVGLRVKNIRYYKSQPWSFSDSVMIGFYAELDGDDTVTLQEEELAEATWFHKTEIPWNENKLSIGQELIEGFRNSR